MKNYKMFDSNTVPLSLYIHFPWCIQKCPYCDFNSYTLQHTLDENAYIQALIQDLSLELPNIWGRSIISIFLGGGTPSLFSATALEQLLNQLRALLKLRSHIEITLEANPGSFEIEKFKAFKAIGINRLSLGIQSFNDGILQKLGRIHNAKQAYQACEKSNYFDNVNIDLMYGLPEQCLEKAAYDVNTALSFQPQHISYYQLTIEPNTWFYHHPPLLPEEDMLWDIQEQGLTLLQAQDYQQYEISAHAKKGFQCQHNLNYWQFGDYLGIGAGAHSKITLLDKILRFSKIRQPEQYIKGVKNQKHYQEKRSLSKEEIGLEFMMNALRLYQGFSTALFQQHTGLSIDIVAKPLQKAQNLELITWNEDKINTTEKGKHYLNQLLSLF